MEMAVDSVTSVRILKKSMDSVVAQLREEVGPCALLRLGGKIFGSK